MSFSACEVGGRQVLVKSTIDIPDMTIKLLTGLFNKTNKQSKQGPVVQN